mmetsp:Transcript_19769/g.61400  ORF Transcript_19769/g.61400 Transcript_19769/m.61400 type:complete len:218 (+) Transcript_19769:284-937(+)
MVDKCVDRSVRLCEHLRFIPALTFAPELLLVARGFVVLCRALCHHAFPNNSAERGAAHRLGHFAERELGRLVRRRVPARMPLIRHHRHPVCNADAAEAHRRERLSQLVRAPSGGGCVDGVVGRGVRTTEQTQAHDCIWRPPPAAHHPQGRREVLECTRGMVPGDVETGDDENVPRIQPVGPHAAALQVRTQREPMRLVEERGHCVVQLCRVRLAVLG